MTTDGEREPVTEASWAKGLLADAADQALKDDEQAMLARSGWEPNAGLMAEPCQFVKPDGTQCGKSYRNSDWSEVDHAPHTYQPTPVRSRPPVPGYYAAEEV